MEDFKHKLKRLRQLRNYSQDELAKKIGISRSAYNLIETGKTKNIYIDVGRKLSEALNVSFGELFETDVYTIGEETFDSLSDEIIALSKTIEDKELMIKMLESKMLNYKNILIEELFFGHHLKDTYLLKDLDHKKHILEIEKRRKDNENSTKNLINQLLKNGLIEKSDLAHIYNRHKRLNTQGEYLSDIFNLK
jgi:transcriptional regulator with XRE-family HTH domain